MKMQMSKFYCINCGNEGIDLPRKRSHLHKAGHFKKLYCIHCKQVCNHYECHTSDDVVKFKEKFENGDFIEEAKKSLEECEQNKEWWI